MKIALLYNPLSGRGRARLIADRLMQELGSDGHELRQAAVVPTAATARSERERALAEALAWDGAGAEALIIIGGDGTVHHALPTVLEHRTPVFHMPLGTENLFSRQFGMKCDSAVLRRALAGGRVVQADVGVCNGTPFALMCSLGPDANVVHRLAATRRGRISHLSYVRPGVMEMVRPVFPTLSIEVDGKPLVQNRRGLLIVANSRQYALRIDPAMRASMTDGLLDVVFLPCGSSARVLSWAVSSRLRRHLSGAAAIYATGREVRAVIDGAPARYQIDGEAGVAGGTERLQFNVRPGAMRVLAV